MVRGLKAALCCALVAGLAGAGCKDDSVERQHARLRFVHASANAPAVDVYSIASNIPLVTNLRFRQVSDYVEVFAGETRFEVRLAGADPSTPPFFQTGTIELPESLPTTAIVGGRYGSISTDDSFRILPLTEAFARPISGSARARFVHASPDAGTLFVDVGDDGSPELGPIERFATSAAEGISVVANRALNLRVFGGQPPRTLSSFSASSLADGGRYFVIATGFVDGLADQAFSLLIVEASGTVDQPTLEAEAIVYGLHLVPDGYPVDVFFGDRELAADLSYGQLSSPMRFAAGTHALDVFATEPGSSRPTGAPATSIALPNLVAGREYLAIASGFAGGGQGPGLELLLIEEGFTRAPVDARLRFVHASPGTPPVDFGSVENGSLGTLVANLAFGEASAAPGLTLAPAAYLLGLAPTGDSTPAATFALELSAGDRLFAVASAGAGGASIQLVVIDTAAEPWTATTVSEEQ